MVDAGYTQKRMEEIQKSGEVKDAFAKLVSGGRYGYKTVCETKPMVFKCHKCKTVVDVANQRFCHECGAKLEMPQRK